MEPLSQDEIRASFVNCSRGEAKGVTMPVGFGELRWENLDFLGWRDPKATGRAYLVVPHEGGIVGLSLRAATPPKGRLRSNMCALCLTTHGVADIALFSSRRAGKPGREGNTLGTYVCANLACSRYVRRELTSEVPQPDESLTLDGRILRLREKVRKFVERVLENQ
ncbi:FBP domain-containing protein [Amycolatopsis sp. H20-H5]|uniref:FBP domain-containing protein n=1 Tax=Amycolatopsis sp. H20-H5 TaxID=3046309 RepID=UPI002DB68317|nr:FBP domain-containing protein [Amycolatopsis sp. H20-H5]MEC3981918.1 FBP domain-containing protein [Amycolatopsis sp. H20-H5]